MERFFAEIRDDAIPPLAAADFCADEHFGAFASFVGLVRRVNVGRRVTGITYESFRPLCRTVFLDICREAEQVFGQELRIYVSHRVGETRVGDASVVVGVGAIHRDEACEACRYVIEELKHRAPIWKLEHYEDGDSGWVPGHCLCQERRAGDRWRRAVTPEPQP